MEGNGGKIRVFTTPFEDPNPKSDVEVLIAGVLKHLLLPIFGDKVKLCARPSGDQRGGLCND